MHVYLYLPIRFTYLPMQSPVQVWLKAQPCASSDYLSRAGPSPRNLFSTLSLHDMMLPYM